jgi:hypothetical protein
VKFPKGGLQALPANIRPGWKRLTVTNTPASYGTELITAAKSFMLQVAAKPSQQLQLQIRRGRKKLKEVEFTSCD